MANAGRPNRELLSRVIPLSAAGVLVLAAATIIGLIANVSSALFIILVLILVALAAVLAIAVLTSPSDRPKSTTDASGTTTYTFKDEQVAVVVRPQRRPVSPMKLPLLPQSRMRSTNDEFTPHRIVMNLEMVSDSDLSTVVTNFDPPLELRIGYTAADLQRLQSLKQQQPADLKHGAEPPTSLQFGFWDGCRWILFTEQKHRLTIQPNDPPETGGVAIVTLSEWIDPNVGVGP